MNPETARFLPQVWQGDVFREIRKQPVPEPFDKKFAVGFFDEPYGTTNETWDYVLEAADISVRFCAPARVRASLRVTGARHACMRACRLWRRMSSPTSRTLATSSTLCPRGGWTRRGAATRCVCACVRALRNSRAVGD
jgi:hypothetical protein